MKRLLVLLSLATAFALVACQNQGAREGGQGTETPGQGQMGQPEEGSDVRTAFPDQEEGAATGQDQDPSPLLGDDEERPGGSMVNPQSPGAGQQDQQAPHGGESDY